MRCPSPCSHSLCWAPAISGRFGEPQHWHKIGSRELLVWHETTVTLKCLLEQRPELRFFRVFTQLDTEPGTPEAGVDSLSCHLQVRRCTVSLH